MNATPTDVAVAVEIVRTALRTLDEALDRPADQDTVQAAYVTVRQLERQLHELTNKAGRQAEFSLMGPR
jgi:hypothetical protein